jgi:hypothetical protein
MSAPSATGRLQIGGASLVYPDDRRGRRIHTLPVGDLDSHLNGVAIELDAHREMPVVRLQDDLVEVAAHTLSSWTPSGLNDCAVSARPTPTQIAHHPQVKGSPSFPDQRKRRRRIKPTGSSDRATAGAGQRQRRPFSLLPW